MQEASRGIYCWEMSGKDPAESLLTWGCFPWFYLEHVVGLEPGAVRAADSDNIWCPHPLSGMHIFLSASPQWPSAQTLLVTGSSFSISPEPLSTQKVLIIFSWEGPPVTSRLDPNSALGIHSYPPLSREPGSERLRHPERLNGCCVWEV